VTPDNHRQGVIQTVDYTTNLATVTVGGTTITALCIGELPVVGATVWIEQRGDNRSDWVIIGTQSLGGRAGVPMSRYTWSKIANGVAASAFIDVGTPATNAWISAAAAANVTTITINKQCHLDLWIQWINQWSMLQTLTIGGTSWTGTHFAESQSGGVYRGSMQLSALLDVNDTISIGARNGLASLNDLTFKGVMTFTDVVVGTMQT
jgi:hypothetical protein